MSSVSKLSLRNVEELLRALNGALRVAQLYPRGHQSIAVGLHKAAEALGVLLETKERVQLGILEDEVVFGDRAVYQSTQYAGFLIQMLRDHGVDRVTIRSGCTSDDLGEFVDVLQRDVQSISDLGGVQQALQARGVRSILLEGLASPALRKKSEMEHILPSPDTPASFPNKLIVQATSGLHELADSLSRQKPITADPAKVYAYELTQALVDGQSPLLSLALMESHVEGWVKRLVKVSTLAVAFAKHLKLTQQEVESLGAASFLYDIGLLGLGIDLDDLDRDNPQYSKHPSEGARILLSGQNVEKLAVVVAFEHHMWHDLSGFPKVFGKRRIHPVAELVGLADSFVNLVTGTAKRKGLRSDQAILELSKFRGKRFDDKLFARFVAMTGVFAPGTFVQLQDGRVGLVLRTHPVHMLRPAIRIVLGEDGVLLPKPIEIDLASEPAAVAILEAIDPEEKGLDPQRYWRPRGPGE